MKIKNITVKQWSVKEWDKMLKTLNILIDQFNLNAESNKLDKFPELPPDIIGGDKDYYFVNSKGTISSAFKNSRHSEKRRRFGNYFKTYKLAEEARKRMVTLFERVKKGKSEKKIKTERIPKDMYCVKCRRNQEVKDIEQITLKNGKGCLRAKCRVCGTSVFRISP